MSDISLKRGQNALDQFASVDTSDSPWAQANRVQLTRASDVQIKPVDWLWNGYLPRGMLTLLAGLPGCGKSTLALAFAATITSTGRWPCGGRVTKPGSVLIWSSEDAIDVTLAPRLKAMGADLSRVHFVTGLLIDGHRQPFDPSRDIGQLSERVTAIGDVSMVVFDPILSAVAGDSHKASETRRGLQAVVDIAAEHNLAVLGITHFSKGSSGASPAERVIGSQAFSALARMVLVAAKVETASDGEESKVQRIIARAKSNISADDGGYNFNLELVDIGNGIEAQRVTWGEPIKGSALAMLNEAERTEDDSGDASALDEAVEFLQTALSGGQVLSKEVESEAKAAGVSKSTLNRARAKLRVKASKSAMMGGWVLSLPNNSKATEESQKKQPEILESLESLRDEASIEVSQTTEESQESQEIHTVKPEILRVDGRQAVTSMEI